VSAGSAGSAESAGSPSRSVHPDNGPPMCEWESACVCRYVCMCVCM
jgi:hypothetical protein